MTHYVISSDKSVAVLDDGTMQMYLWKDSCVEKVLSSSTNYNVPEGLKFPTDPLPEDWVIEQQFKAPYISYKYHNIVMIEESPLIYRYFCRLREELDMSQFTIEVYPDTESITIKPSEATIYLIIDNGRLCIQKARGKFTPYLDYIFHVIENYA